MSTQPVIFDLKYTPYCLKRGATADEIAAHKRERAFFTMSSEDNIYKYMTTEEKQRGGTAFEYLQKNTGVFNDKGMLSDDEIKAMKERLRNNKGNVWHGFVSLNKEQSKKIDTPEKCIRLVKATFPQFFKESHLGEKNIDLMCALHLDRPHHLHYHFVFWEKEPKYKGKDGEKKYRYIGRISEKAMDNFFVRTGLFLKDDKERLYQTRAEAIKKLKELTYVKKAMSGDKVIRERILALAKSLPEKGRLSYGSEDMKPFRKDADEIVRLMLDRDKRARKANARFYAAIEKRKRDVLNICGEYGHYSESDGKTLDEIIQGFDEYRHKIYFDGRKVEEEKRKAVLFDKGKVVFDIMGGAKDKEKAEEQKENEDAAIERIDELDEKEMTGDVEKVKDLDRQWEEIADGIHKKVEQFSVYLKGKDEAAVRSASLDNIVPLLLSLMEEYNRTIAQKMQRLADDISLEEQKLLAIQSKAEGRNSTGGNL